jgi:hypothetical protein
MNDEKKIKGFMDTGGGTVLNSEEEHILHIYILECNTTYSNGMLFSNTTYILNRLLGAYIAAPQPHL